jgi:ferredoxin-NADP reductase
MAIANSLSTQLTKSESVAEGTMAFHFAKPAGFEFRAGQSIDLTLLNPPETDAEGNTRAFSIASAPFDNELMITTRMRDTAFKRTLGKASPGLEVRIEGPSGSFVLHRRADRPAVFLAGGIGITPFLSIIRQAARDKIPHQLYLFYSNRRPEDAPFLDVLTETAKQNPAFHLIATMTEMDKSHREWKGERGLLTKQVLMKNLPTIQGPIYYLAGPPGMVAAMRRMLVDAGVDEDDIRTEEFSGY